MLIDTRHFTHVKKHDYKASEREPVLTEPKNFHELLRKQESLEVYNQTRDVRQRVESEIDKIENRFGPKNVDDGHPRLVHRERPIVVEDGALKAYLRGTRASILLGPEGPYFEKDMGDNHGDTYLILERQAGTLRASTFDQANESPYSQITLSVKETAIPPEQTLESWLIAH